LGDFNEVLFGTSLVGVAGSFELRDLDGVDLCALDRLGRGSSRVREDDRILVLTCEVGVDVVESTGGSTRVDGDFAFVLLVERRGVKI
jgi:hypothetical protein